MVNIETNKKIIQGSILWTENRKEEKIFILKHGTVRAVKEELYMHMCIQFLHNYASSFYMCTQFLHLLPVFCLACSFDIIKCIQFKIAFPWVCWGETRIAWHKTREGKKLSCLQSKSERKIQLLKSTPHQWSLNNGQ